MKTYDRLLLARKKIENPENWTQGELARNINGKPVPVKDTSAVQWCLIGAIQHGTNYNSWFYTENCSIFPSGIRKILNTVIGTESTHISDFNDSHSHAEVLALLDKAIEMTKDQKD